MLTYDLKTRARMYLWVTLLCGATAAMMQLFLGPAPAKSETMRNGNSTMRYGPASTRK